ncbi:MAG TPA: CoA-transferase [Opitutaceae bacterium]|nr:CoA-transferase [Opitutaceae bacterium]
MPSTSIQPTANYNKVCSLAQAVRSNVSPGSTVFFGGMQHGEPSAAIHEIVRQRIGNLTIVSALTHTVALLLGEGLLHRLVTAYLVDLYEKDTCIAARARRKGSFPTLEELSHYGLSLALLAGQMGVPYQLTRSQLGTSYPAENPNLRETICPFTGQRLMAIRAINPDVGFLHTQQCDPTGAAHRWGTLGMDVMGINACRKIVITTEKIVPSHIIQRDPNRTVVPGYRVAAVVEVPWGAYPLHLSGFYDSDLPSFFAACRDERTYQGYVDRYVYGVGDRTEMMTRLTADRGSAFLDRLRSEPSAVAPHR